MPILPNLPQNSYKIIKYNIVNILKLRKLNTLVIQNNHVKLLLNV